MRLQLVIKTEKPSPLPEVYEDRKEIASILKMFADNFRLDIESPVVSTWGGERFVSMTLAQIEDTPKDAA